LKEYRLAALHAPAFPSLDLHVALASAFFARGDLAEAERWLRLVVQTQPGSAEARFDLGTVYRKQGKWPEAMAAFREALRLKPQYPKAHYALGVVLQQLGRYEEAQQAFGRAELQAPRGISGENRWP
jgi:Flp pilus assembly protein TadD